jgi:periplasmic protein TonB
MTEAAVFVDLPGAPTTPEPFPAVKPRWLTPATTIVAVLAHIGVAVLLMTTAIDKSSPLDNSLSLDLVPEGDTMESEEAAAMDIAQPQPEAVQEAELALPPPQLMAPEAIPLPQKKETVEPKKHVEPKPQVAPSNQRQEASERHRLGVQGGRASTLSRAGYMGLLAAAIRRHVPQFSSLGEGTASCSFHVNAGGGIGGVSCSGSTPTHMAMLRSALLATHAPPPPGGGLSTSQSVRFH